MKVRSRSIVRDCVRWTGSNIAEVHDLVRVKHARLNNVGQLVLKTLHDWVHCEVGSYVFTNDDVTEAYPVAQDEFDKRYETVDGSADVQASIVPAPNDLGWTWALHSADGRVLCTAALTRDRTKSQCIAEVQALVQRPLRVEICYPAPDHEQEC
jgi:hypothetical protein